MDLHAKLIYTPKVVIEAERVAENLGISLEKADQLLSRPETFDLLMAAISRGVQDATLAILKEIARIPHEKVEVRRDALIEVSLPPLFL